MAWSNVLGCPVLICPDSSAPVPTCLGSEMSWVRSVLTSCLLLVSALSLPKPLVSAECSNLTNSTFDPSLVTTPSVLVQQIFTLTVRKSDVCSKNTEQKMLHIVKYCFGINGPPAGLTNSLNVLISYVSRRYTEVFYVVSHLRWCVPAHVLTNPHP